MILKEMADNQTIFFGPKGQRLGYSADEVINELQNIYQNDMQLIQQGKLKFERVALTDGKLYPDDESIYSLFDLGPVKTFDDMSGMYDTYTAAPLLYKGLIVHEVGFCYVDENYYDVTEYYEDYPYSAQECISDVYPKTEYFMSKIGLSMPICQKLDSKFYA